MYLRLPDPDGGAGQWITEHDRTGRRLRQIEVTPNGRSVATTDQDWPMNPPFDLGDPTFVSHEITSDEFEEVWQRATGMAG